MSKKLKLASRDKKQSLKLIYEWIKTGCLTLKEFEQLYPFIDKQVCEGCGSEREIIEQPEN